MVESGRARSWSAQSLERRPALLAFAWLVVLLSLRPVSTVSAQLAVEPAATALTTQNQRASFALEDALLAEGRRAFVWRTSWTAINAGLALGAVASVPLMPESERPSLWIAAATSSVSALFTFLFPLVVEDYAAELARLRAHHGSAERDTRVRTMYVTAAEDEGSRQQWPWHVINAVAALVPGAILWLAYDQLGAGLLQFGSGVLLGELALLTQPTGLAGRWKSTIALQAHVQAEPGAIAWTLSVSGI